MADIALHMVAGEELAFDLVMDGGRLATDEGLRTAIAISLFTDRRAADDDELPDAGADRRGWWGDIATAVEGDLIGSRLWLLRRSKITSASLARARDYCREALAWLTEDRIASAVEIEVEAQRPDRLAIGVIVSRPGGPQRERFDYVWNAVA